MKYLLTFLFGCLMISGFAQKKESASENNLPYIMYSLPNIKYLDLLEVHQKMVYSYKDSYHSNRCFELDTIYYRARYEPYEYDKRKFSLDVTYQLIVMNSKGDTIMTQFIHSEDSIKVPILIKDIKDDYTRIVVYASSVKRNLHRKKSLLFRDKIGEVMLSNTTHYRYAKRACNDWGHSRWVPYIDWRKINHDVMGTHGYNLNQIAVKTIPGVN